MDFVQKLVILMFMFFCHIFADYSLQGILAQMKQQKWWEKNAPNPKYRRDYIIALFEHSFSWSFVTFAPLLQAAYVTQSKGLAIYLIVAYFLNTVIHGIVDDLKANRHVLSLVEDQMWHFIQIIATWIISIGLY